MIGLVLVTHGRLAVEFLVAMEHVVGPQQAIETICIGPARASQSYLQAEQVVRAALALRADAIHPGYGFLSENERFAEIIEAQAIGNYVLMREHVTRGPATDGSDLVEPFDVVAVYSFEGDKCSRVEFIR